MDNTKLCYLGGGIMSRGDNLAREEEYQKFIEANIPVEVYSPVKNKSINDKSNMTEEENNCLAEKIVEQDVERLWNSDIVVMCPEQSAIGSMCETAVLYGWKYMSNKIAEIIKEYGNDKNKFQEIINSLNKKILNKDIYCHYSDIRTNHLNEKDWRRSFSINQMLYGMILEATSDHTLHNSFDEVMKILKEKFDKDE